MRVSLKREFKGSFQVYSVRRRGGVGEVTAATVTGVETKRELGSSTLPLFGINVSRRPLGRLAPIDVAARDFGSSEIQIAGGRMKSAAGEGAMR